jgi:hypothetical protein
MHKFLKSYLVLFVITLFTMPYANAQEVRVIDNKGTIKTIRNNNVYTSATNPNTSSTIAIENDVWIDTSTSPSTFKVWNNSNQWTPIEFGKSLLSVTTIAANQNTEFTPTNNQVNSREWVNMDVALPATSISVKAGDFVDVRVNISEDFPTANTINGSTYNDIGDVLRFYTTNPNLIGSPTMIETLITGGDNSYEIAAGSLNQLFTVIGDGTLTIGIEVKYNASYPRVYSTDRSGRGGLQVIIYR